MKTSPASVARLHRLSLVAAALGTLTLAACGGGSSSTTTTTVEGAFPAAYVVIGQSNFSNNDVNENTGVPSASSLAQPQGAAGSNGTLLYIPDLNNNRILGFNALPTANNATANFALGQNSLTSNGAGTSSTSLKLPGRVWVANSGQLVVADTNNNRVLIWNSLPSGGNVAADIVVGQTDFTSSAAGLSSTQLSGPTAAVIASGKLIVVDQSNNRVLVWNSVPTTNGAAADVVIGQPNFTSNTANNSCTVATPDCSNTPVASQYNLNQPFDAWADDTGRLLVADSSDNRVLYWSQIPTSNLTTANYVLGQSSFTRVSSSVSASGFNDPVGVASDGTRVYIADTNNNRVLVFSGFPTSNGASATTVIGQNNFTHNAYNDDDQDGVNTDSSTPTAHTLYHPTGVSIYPNSGKLFVTDRDNNRVLGFTQ